MEEQHERASLSPFHDDLEANNEEHCGPVYSGDGEIRSSHDGSKKKGQKKDDLDVGLIRTDAPEGIRFLVLRDNHSATTPGDVNLGRVCRT